MPNEKQRLESMINRGRDTFIELLDNFLKRNNKSVSEYLPPEFMDDIDDDGIAVLDTFRSVEGSEKFIKSCNLLISGYSEDRLGRKVMQLKPINNDVIWDNDNKILFRFSDKYHDSGLYHISSMKNYDSIMLNGLVPRARSVDDDERNFETYDARIYLIVDDLIGVNGDDDFAHDISEAIKFLTKEFKDKYGDTNFDLWEVTLPPNVKIHRDPSFLYGGFVKNPIPPKNVKLITVKERDKFFS